MKTKTNRYDAVIGAVVILFIGAGYGLILTLCVIG